MPREKKTRTEAEYQELKKATIALAKCVKFTLDTGGKPGVGSGMLYNRETKQVTHWETDFFDALDLIGIEYDREAYFADKPEASPRPLNSALSLAKIEATGFVPEDALVALERYVNAAG